MPIKIVGFWQKKNVDVAKAAALFCILTFSCFVAGCGRQRIDLRALLPAETIVYLESDDLGKALGAIVNNKNFKRNSSVEPDLASLNGVQIAVAVTDFVTSEKKVTDQQSILNFTPKFVVVAETHAWSWQVNAIVENDLDNFVKEKYGNDTKLDKSDGANSRRYVWTASDGRKTFAATSDATIFFSNDEDVINKSILAKSGDAANLLKNTDLESAYARKDDSVVFGYVSKQGVEKIADIFGVSVAVGQSDDENVRGIIARILPKIARNTVEEIVWTANLKEDFIEDRLFVRTNKEASGVLSETIKSSTTMEGEIFDLLPNETKTLTRYNLKKPQIAFRGLLLTVAKNVDGLEKNLIAASSNSLLEPYGIKDAERFLSLIHSNFVTVQLDNDGAKSLAIVQTEKFDDLKKTISGDVDFDTASSSNPEIWKSKSGDFSVAKVGKFMLLGERESVANAITMWRQRKLSPIDPKNDFTKSREFAALQNSDAASTTFSTDAETFSKMIKILGQQNGSGQIELKTVTKTFFTKEGVERHYISDFGIFGTLVEQFDFE